MRHYACHSMAALAALPVADVVARDAFLFFWTTSPLISTGAHIPVMRAWGFEPTAMGFVWIKLIWRPRPCAFASATSSSGPD